MSNWDVQYHLRELEKESGQKWMRQPASLTAAQHAATAAKTRLTIVQSVARLLGVFAVLAPLLFAAGISVAIWSTLAGIDAGDAAAALIVPGVLVGIAAPGLRLALAMIVLPGFQSEYYSAEAALDLIITRTLEGDQ